MKILRKAVVVFAIAAATVRTAFADALPPPEPQYNDYIPFVSYLVVGALAVIIIAAVIVLFVLIRKRRRNRG